MSTESRDERVADRVEAHLEHLEEKGLIGIQGVDVA